jgi:DNA (cytosine-5)-methyltransferase 1
MTEFDSNGNRMTKKIQIRVKKPVSKKIQIHMANESDGNISFIDLFAGTGAFSYVFETNTKFKCVFANDMIQCSEQIYNLNHPQTSFVLKDLNDINPKDIPEHQLLCGGFPCFIAGTQVLTHDGYKKIEDLTLQDSVLTHKGQFRVVLNLQKKIYKGDLYEFKIKYHPNVIKCTEDRPFYVREKRKIWDNVHRKYNVVFEQPLWKKAKEITHNDYFGMVINDNEIIPETLYNEDEWFMMGYFVGDGWIEETCRTDGRCLHKIRFAINDAEIVSRISKTLPITDKKCVSGKCKKYGCSNSKWFYILKQFGKYAYGKLIPEWVQNAPKNLIKSFISGYMKADGCINKNGSLQITTVSFNLAMGLQRLYLKLGYIFSVIKFVRPKQTLIEGRLVNQRDTYKVLGKYEKSRYTSFIEDKYVWCANATINKSHSERETVYNCEVETDNSYVVENIIVHNCQPFSIAGKQKGFEDKRSNVFWKILEIIQFHQPEIVILENVKNLKSHDDGKTYQIIEKHLTAQGYLIKSQILDTCQITNVPQHRERIYIVCFKNKDQYEQFDFDFPTVENKKIIEFLEKDVPQKYYYTDKFKVFDEIKQSVVKHINENVLYQYRRYYTRENKSNCCPTLTANMGGGGHNVPLLMDDHGIRKLAPRECFNLQGFPTAYQLPNLCDSALYKLAGNAVSIPVIDLIAKKIALLF